MTLCFPNRSRSFETKKNRVRFWGYDSAIEITFFVDADTLQKLRPDVSSAEVGFLEAFDSMLERIHQIASKVYERSRERSDVYVLAAKDF